VRGVGGAILLVVDGGFLFHDLGDQEQPDQNRANWTAQVKKGGGPRVAKPNGQFDQAHCQKDVLPFQHNSFSVDCSFAFFNYYTINIAHRIRTGSPYIAFFFADFALVKIAVVF
jgi:hypothetical protein